jgi:predicted kinase
MTQAFGVLIALSGLPGTGKSTLARHLAHRYGALHLRIDSIEQALMRTGMTMQAIGPAGYVVAYALAEDNLRLGRTVVADAVNPLAVTRTGWQAVAARAGVSILEVEVCCSNVQEHRRRVESRVADIPGHVLPTWQNVQGRDYEPWSSERVIIDTADASVDDCLQKLDHSLRTMMDAPR